MPSDKERLDWLGECIVKELTLSPHLKPSDIEDALFNAVFNARCRYGRDRTRAELRFVFMKQDRVLAVKCDIIGNSFMNDVLDHLCLVEKAG